MSEYRPIFYEQPFTGEFLEVLQRVSIPFFSQKDTPFSPRMINYYDSKNLLMYPSEKGKKRLFTGEQLFWLYILHDTAKLGYTLFDNLLSIKDKFEKTEVIDGKFDEFRFLQHQLAVLIFNRMELHLKIDEDCSYTFFSYHDWRTIEEGNFLTASSHINIALGPIAKKIWKGLTGKELQFQKPSLATAAYSNKESMKRMEQKDFERIEANSKGDERLGIKIKEKESGPSAIYLKETTIPLERKETALNRSKESAKRATVPGAKVTNKSNKNGKM